MLCACVKDSLLINFRLNFRCKAALSEYDWFFFLGWSEYGCILDVDLISFIECEFIADFVEITLHISGDRFREVSNEIKAISSMNIRTSELRFAAKTLIYMGNNNSPDTDP